ncbi:MULTISPECIES: DNA cytosine methyltransferase [unclassified Massilia]|uniref:DNA cytosine methyltransferase n=1 Tax=unclassified Massilia TaxID=2609279 RepID=UPI001785EBD4|nr:MULTISPECIES: DNA cytosine methyltransferase [unclassified Massilia]MBD8531535.1 DNA cytosine methyltransferase [Massilia sp. CFBP 13647]MBD8673669.1 DNA cytosine methyltransferase [Massilia sp. CFBP 13721]
MKPNYYNEIDKYAAEWLVELIAAGHIAPGVVDTRSIEDVHPADLQDFAQCHFFAGIGVWSLALRRAGWPDDRPVWTGSCPCQPFSAAGQGAGFADERHLWPAFYHLIKQHDEWCRAQKRRPPVILGEQVASKDADPWIDLVHADLEALGYAFGAVPFPSAGVGAPHIRDRLYWVANAGGERRGRRQGATHGRLDDRTHAGRFQGNDGAVGDGEAGIVRLADTDGGNASAERQQRSGEQRQQPEDGSVISLADASRSGRREERADGGGRGIGDCQEGITSGSIDGGSDLRPGPTNGYWRDADWLGCRDGKWRPVEPGTFPLAHGAASRVGRLRAYGNAINAEAARVFIEAVMEAA